MPGHILTIRRSGAFAARTAVATLALAVLAAAPASARALQAPGVAGWQRTDLRPVTQPAPAGGLFVLYAAGPDRSLQLIAVDPGTGRTAWSRPASPSEVTPGEAPSLTVVGDTVIYLGRGFATNAAVTAVDARTGAIVWQTAEGDFTTWPALCPGNDAVICVSTAFIGLIDGGELRFDAATGRRLRSVRIPGLDTPREVGPGLVDAGARDPERLVALRGGSQGWNRRLSGIFGAGVSTDFGWNFGRYDDVRLFVGSVGPKPIVRHGRTTFRYADERTVGFRIVDGRPVWRARGFYACGTLPCQGESQAGYDSPGPETGRAVALRLVATGSLSFGSDADAPLTLSKDARTRIEGFSPRTGRALWHFDAGRNVGLLEFSVPAQTGASTMVIADAAGRLRELDLATGARRAVAADTTGWCRRGLDYPVGTDDYAGQFAAVPCVAATTRRTPTPATVPAFLGGIGATGAGLVAWADTTGLIARPAAP